MIDRFDAVEESLEDHRVVDVGSSEDYRERDAASSACFFLVGSPLRIFSRSLLREFGFEGLTDATVLCLQLLYQLRCSR